MAGIATADANSLASAEVRATAYTGAASLYLSLHTADPGSTGASELSGGGYGRQSITFGAPSGGAATNNIVVTFNNLPAATVTHLSIWDASGGGNFHQSGSLGSPVAVSAGNTLSFATGQVTFTVVAV